MSFENDILTAIKDSKEIQMVGLFCQKKLVSALLVLTSESIAGLYFIVTKKEYQKRGFATILINFILNRMLENHVKKVVLHANHYSFGLYRKLGFVSQNKFVIYKNNEHEHRGNTGKITPGV
jgi:ribosomal protein S18 acetylase RimI-like enzyme